MIVNYCILSVINGTIKFWYLTNFDICYSLNSCSIQGWNINFEKNNLTFVNFVLYFIYCLKFDNNFTHKIMISFQSSTQWYNNQQLTTKTTKF